MCNNIGGARGLKHRSHRELLFCVVAFISSIGGLKLDVVCAIFKWGHKESVRMGHHECVSKRCWIEVDYAEHLFGGLVLRASSILWSDHTCVSCVLD